MILKSVVMVACVTVTFVVLSFAITLSPLTVMILAIAAVIGKTIANDINHSIENGSIRRRLQRRCRR